MAHLYRPSASAQMGTLMWSAEVVISSQSLGSEFSMRTLFDKRSIILTGASCIGRRGRSRRTSSTRTLGVAGD